MIDFDVIHQAVIEAGELIEKAFHAEEDESDERDERGERDESSTNTVKHPRHNSSDNTSQAPQASQQQLKKVLKSKSSSIDVVTETDQKTEEFLVEKLKTSFPNHVIIGEEEYSDSHQRYPPLFS